MKYRPEAVCGTPQESLWRPVDEAGALVPGYGPDMLEECEKICEELNGKDADREFGVEDGYKPGWTEP